MRRFLLKSLFFIIPFCLMVFLFECSIRAIPNDYKTKKEFINQHGSEIKVLALGSSHFYHGFNPEYVDYKAFNFAHIAQTPEYDLKLYEQYISKMDHVKVLIYPISYFTFFWDLPSSSEAWRLKNYQIYYHLDAAQSINDYFEILSVEPSMNLKRLTDYYFKHKSEVGVTPKGWGFNCLAKYAGNLEETAVVSAQRHTAKNWTFYSKNTAEVEKILQLSKEKGIKVILVFPPAYKSYREKIDQKQLRTTYLKIDSLIHQFPNTQFLDFFADTVFTAHDFIDADHLNDIGAVKLSKMINRKIDLIID